MARQGHLPLGKRLRARSTVLFWARKAVVRGLALWKGGWVRILVQPRAHPGAASCSRALVFPRCAQVCFLCARSERCIPGLAELRGLADGRPDGRGLGLGPAPVQSSFLLTECWALSAPQVGKGPGPRQRASHLHTRPQEVFLP